MSKKTIHIIFGAITLLVGAAILLSYRYYPAVVEKYYQNGDFTLLNQMARIDRHETLEYYLGKADDLWVGPLSNCLTYVLLAFLSLIYLPEKSLKSFTAIVFLFLTITKFNTLLYPPYGDAIGGPFAEAIWLADNNFNFVGLFHQPGYAEGGPRVYLFSLYPTYLAILYKLIPSVKLFLIINHLLALLMAAITAGLVREIVNQVHSKNVATLSAIAVMALPVFQSQAEAINMEMPCLLFSVLAIYYLTVKRMGLAALAATISVFIKGHGIIACGSVMLVAVGRFFIDDNKRFDWRHLGWGFLASLSAVLIVLSKFLLKDQHIRGGMVKPLAGLKSLKIMTLPEIFIGSLVVFLIFVLIDKLFKKERVWGKYYVQIVVFIAALMWFMMFLNFDAVSPRYKLALAPYLVLCVIFSVSCLPRISKIMAVLLVVAIGVVAYGSYGAYHGAIGNYHVLSEQSLEYRNDLKLTMQMAQALERDYADHTIGAPFIMAQILAMPQFGYVAKPLHVMVYGMPVTYGKIKNFQGLTKEDIINTVWVAVPADFFTQGDFSYPIHAQDKIIKKFILGHNQLYLFWGGQAIEQRFRLIQYYLHKGSA